MQDNGWRELLNEEIDKINGVYGYRGKPVFYPLSHIRKEIEYTISRNSNVIALNAAPILKVIGGLTNPDAEGDKGAGKKVYRVETGGDVGYVTWQQAIEAIKYQVDSLLKLFFMQLQLPDLSMENMKNLGNIGYDARQTLLSDAHLKVGDEKGAFIEFFEREANVIKHFLKIMNPSWAKDIDDIDIEHVITPFIQNDEKADIDKLMTANGGKALMSQRDSIKRFGFSDDPDQTLKEIQEDDKRESENNQRVNLFETAE